MDKFEKKFNVTVAPMWYTKGQHLFSIEIDGKVLESLNKVKEGGKLLVKFLNEDRRRNDNSPHAYLEYLDAEEVAAYKAKNSKPPVDSL